MNNIVRIDERKPQVPRTPRVPPVERNGTPILMFTGVRYERLTPTTDQPCASETATSS